MSQAEFDSYLSLLSKFLRLRSRQRAELADELRDHLDSRLDELLAQGKSREQAIKIALDEFGDAAVLAEDFSRLASRRNRRFVMRCTAASAAVVAAALLLSIAFAPPGPNGPGPQQVVAQQEARAGGAPVDPNDPRIVALTKDDSPVEQQAIAALERKLGQVVPDVDFIEIPLQDALGLVAQAIEADVLIDRAALENEGQTPDQPVTLTLNRTPVAGRTVLDFLLEPAGLKFVNRAGVIYVTTEAEADEHLTTKVYNVRDLLENATSHTVQQPAIFGGGLGGGGLGGGGFFSVPDSIAAATLANGLGHFDGDPANAGDGSMPGGTGGGLGMGGLSMQTVLTSPAAELLVTIQQTTSGPWHDIDGTGGTMSLFNGLLVVRQTDGVHSQIQKLLVALREADGKQPGDSVTVPKEGEPAAAGVGRRGPGRVEEPAAPEDGRESAWRLLGLRLAPLSVDDAKKLLGGTRYVAGMRITEVRPDSSAANIGLRVGDILVGLGSWEIKSDENLAFVMKWAMEENPGAVKAHVVRGGETLFVGLAFERSEERR